MYKRIVTIVIALVMFLFVFTTTSTSTYAQKDVGSIKRLEDNNLINTSELLKIDDDNLVETSLIMPTYIKKRNVKNSKEWSGAKRISDNVYTTNHTGNITANKSVTFNTTVSGSIKKWLNISIGGSKSSSKSYSMTVPEYSRVYLGYRVKYDVEKGEACNAHLILRYCITDWGEYTIKKPKEGEYLLVKTS